MKRNDFLEFFVQCEQVLRKLKRNLERFSHRFTLGVAHMTGRERGESVCVYVHALEKYTVSVPLYLPTIEIVYWNVSERERERERER